MILKGSQRAGAVELGRHLLKAENEHVEVHEIRGFAAMDVVGALKEAEAISRGTKCQQFLFSLSLNPPEMERVPVSVFEAAIARVEEKLGLTGQPRVIVFHEKEGRRHAHCVWSRIDAASMTAINLPHTRRKLQDLSRALYLEQGWRMPEGMIDPALRNPLNFDRAEWQQAKRGGQDPRAIKAVFQQCWAASDSGKAFGRALRHRGFLLARGDRRGVVALDMTGEVYAVARWANVKTKDVTDRIGDPAALPSVPEAKAEIAQLMTKKLDGFLDSASQDFARAAQALEARRLAMIERQRAERAALRQRQEERQITEAKLRAARFRTGLRGLWDRVTGQHAKVHRQNETEAIKAQRRDEHECQNLVDRHLAERQPLKREIRYSRKVHVREVTALWKDKKRYEEMPRQEETPDDTLSRRQRSRWNHQLGLYR